MTVEPDNLVLQLLSEMRAEMGDMRTDLRAEMTSLRADLRSEMNSLRADVASDLIDIRGEIGALRKDLSDQIVGLRRAVMEYHTSVIGHGILISELEGRLRRVEQHLDLPPLDAH